MVLRQAWGLLAWWHQRAGGLEDEVPGFRPPSKAESHSVFRDAVLGGPHRTGDPEAQYFVALAILQRDQEVIANPGTTPDRPFFTLLAHQAIDLLWRCYYFIPAARSRLAKAWLDRNDEKKQDVLNALDLLDEGIEMGDAECAFLKGAFLHEGRHGLSVDQTQALALFEKAAAEEHPGALQALALYHSSGLGVPVDMELARRWAQRAAELGDPLGLLRFGQMLVEGLGGPTEPLRGAALIRRSLELRVHDAAWVLSQYLRNGVVDAVGDETADALFNRACDERSTLAIGHRLEGNLKTARKRGPNGDLDVWHDVIRDLHTLHQATSPNDMRELICHTNEVLNDLKQVATQIRDPERRRPLTSLLTNFRPDGTARTPKERDRLIGDGLAWNLGDGEYNHEAMTALAQFFGGFEADPARDADRRAHIARDKEDLRARAKKAGRNAPCPCGSGRKSKRCHGR